jgi:hypothetical protein
MKKEASAQNGPNHARKHAVMLVGAAAPVRTGGADYS